VLYEKLNRVSAFVASMARGFSALLPKQLIEPYPYPCVVKQQYSFAGCGVQIAQSADDLPIAYACVQEPIYGGVEYVEHAVVLAGVVRARVRFRVQLAGDLVVKQGRLVGEEVASDPFLDPVFAQLGYTGFACANFKLVDRQPKIFEINPRMGGSLVFSDRLGDMLDCVRGLFA
jgi:biotin carboxylase